MGIPEPSESDFRDFKRDLLGHWESSCLFALPSHRRVIAHLILNGAALADSVRADDQAQVSDGCFSLLHGERRDNKLANAVELFERLRKELQNVR